MRTRVRGKMKFHHTIIINSRAEKEVHLGVCQNVANLGQISYVVGFLQSCLKQTLTSHQWKQLLPTPFFLTKFLIFVSEFKKVDYYFFILFIVFLYNLISLVFVIHWTFIF